ncbi:MAG: AMP-binding protein [Syntrophorhabdales bacterium]
MALDYKSYEEALAKFKWGERWSLFDGRGANFNITHECVDRHPKDETAIRIKFADRTTKMYSFGDFSRVTSQFAHHLERVRVERGESVAILLFPSIEFYTSMFGIFKRGAVAVSCFPLFGREAVNFRLEKSKASAIVTTQDMMSLIDEELAVRLGLKVIVADDLMEKLKKEDDYYNWNTDVNTPCMMQFSSGTTGAPKAMMYRHGAITVSAVVMKLGNGVYDPDTYFCPSSPGWGHGIWYGTIGPLSIGKALGTFSGKFDPEVALEALEEWGVTRMAAISSHYRLMLESGKADRFKIKLQSASYTGEPMTKGLINLIKDTWGFSPGTQYGTTEVGPIAMDFLGFDNWVVKPGSLGKAMIGGIKVAVLDEDENPVPPGVVGQMAISRDNGQHWDKLGDSGYMDEDHYYWYVSRIDDVIISAGYTIGPVEVEEALRKHPAVEESGVVASPDKDRGDIVKAFIKLNPGYEPSEKLAKEIQEFVKTKLSKHEYPRDIAFIDELPKTVDGKIKRKELKERERRRKMGG